MQPAHWIVITLVVAWAAVVLAAMWQANQRALHRHRERLAMIEKGLPVPSESPVTSPWRALQGAAGSGDHAVERRMLDFIRFVGTLTVAAGIGLFLLLNVMDEWRAAVGFGGLTVLIGIALILTTTRALMITRRHRNGHSTEE
jgi:hypothetical protein